MELPIKQIDKAHGADLMRMKKHMYEKVLYKLFSNPFGNQSKAWRQKLLKNLEMPKIR